MATLLGALLIQRGPKSEVRSSFPRVLDFLRTVRSIEKRGDLVLESPDAAFWQEVHRCR